MPNTTQKLASLRAALHERIRGQADAVNRLFETVARRELNAVRQRGPRGCYFFAGPTGVGKTATAKILAEVLHADCRFLRIDCSEFKTLASLETLLGNRAGDRGRLGQCYDRSPEGVWLWDEIEKAHRELVQLFLQMADEGRVTLTCGDTLDLRGINLVVTSNLGSAEILGMEHLSFTSLERHVVRAIEQFLGPELLARFGKPFVFRPLDREAQAEIVEQRLDDMVRWQAEQGRRLSIDGDVASFLIYRGFSPRLGARPLLDFIEESVGNAIVENLLAGGDGCGRLVVAGDRLQLVS